MILNSKEVYKSFQEKCAKYGLGGALTPEEESLARAAMEYTARMTGLLKE